MRPFLGLVSLIVFLAVVVVSDMKAEDTIRVGLIQMNARLYDKEYNLAQAESLIRQAAARGATIVCTPEAAVQGYARVDLPPGTSADAPELVARGRKSWRRQRPSPARPPNASAHWQRSWEFGSYSGWTRTATASCLTLRS